MWHLLASVYFLSLWNNAYGEYWRRRNYAQEVNFILEKSVITASDLSCVGFCFSQLDSQLISFDDYQCNCLISEPSSHPNEINLTSVLEKSSRESECVLKGYEVFESQQFCLKYYSSLLNWTQALTQCRADGGYLVDLSSTEKFYTIGNYTQQQNIEFSYVGGYDYGEGTQNFRWLRGGMVANWQWNENEPDNLDLMEYCLSLFTSASSAGLYDILCDREQAFLCELIL